MIAESFNLFNFFVLLGILQGFVLACILVFTKKFQKTANYALAISLFAITFLGIGQIMYDLSLRVDYPIISFLPIRYTILPAIASLYYIIFEIKPDYRFSKKDGWVIAPFIILLIIDLILLTMYLINPSIGAPPSKQLVFYWDAKELVTIVFSIVVIVWAYKQHQDLPQSASTTLNPALLEKWAWVKNNSLAAILAWSAWAVPQTYAIFSGEKFWWLYYPTWIGMFIMIFWLGYFMILQRDFFEVQHKETTSPSNSLSKNTAEHYEKLLQLMQKEKLYRNPDLNMDLLAEKTQLSNGYLSQIINQKEGKNFYEFVNTYRIEEVKAHLADPQFAHYSILGIGLEAGFKSKSTFNAAFKKLTGQTPSAFRNQ